MPWYFDGFTEPNYTQIPDAFFDQVMCHLSEAELRVALYIMRRTFGFKKREDPISYNQFLRGIHTRDGRQLDEGCGISGRTNLTRALAGLEEKGVITATKQTGEKGDPQTTVYALRFQGVVPRSDYPVVGVVTQHDYPPSHAALPGVVTQRDLQKTVEQETDISQETESASKTSKGLSELERIVTDISKELSDLEHVRSNRTRAANLADQYDLHDATMVRLCQAALETVKPRVSGLERPMAYWFETLEERCKTAPAARQSLAGKYWRLVQR